MTRVALVAASPVERAGLEAIVRAGDLEVATSVDSVQALRDQLSAIEPEAVLVALDAHDDEPPADVVALSSAAGAPPVAVLSAGSATGWIVDALRAGIRSVLPRDATAGEIVGALTAIAHGLVAIHPDVVDTFAHEVSAAPRSGDAPMPHLTPRELDVLRMLAEGLGNKTISARLGISEHTVKFHLASVFAKLHAGSRTEAVTQGVRQGLILL